VKREIGNLKVKCENYMVGCSWTGLFKELMVWCVYFIVDYVLPSTQVHLKDCQFKSIVCSNPGCGGRVLLSEFEEHLKEKCLHRQVECKDCGKKMPFVELQV